MWDMEMKAMTKIVIELSQEKLERNMRKNGCSSCEKTLMTKMRVRKLLEELTDLLRFRLIYSSAG